MIECKHFLKNKIINSNPFRILSSIDDRFLSPPPWGGIVLRRVHGYCLNYYPDQYSRFNKLDLMLFKVTKIVVTNRQIVISTPAIGANFAITLGANREKMLVGAWECLINFRTRSLWANLEQVQLRLSWRQVKLAVETSPTHYSNTNRPQHFFSEKKKKEICSRPFFSFTHFLIVPLMHCIGTKYCKKTDHDLLATFYLWLQILGKRLLPHPSVQVIRMSAI